MTQTTGSPDTIDTDVVVLGGGLAGITCAIGLLGSGLKVTLVEREENLGGRAASWTDQKTGDVIDIGPHIFLKNLYPNLMALLRILGTADEIVWNDEQFITLVENGRRYDLTMSRLPPPLHALPWVLADDKMSLWDKLSNVPVTLYAMQMDEADVLRLDATNASAVLESFGVTRRYIDRFWAFICMAIMNVPIELCSAGALLRFYQAMIGHNTYTAGFARSGLGSLFFSPARRLIEEGGGEIMTGTEARALLGDDGRTRGVRLADGRRVEASAGVVSSLPPQALRRIIPDNWRAPQGCLKDLVHFNPSPYISLYLWFDRKLTDLKFWARAYRPNNLNCDFYDLSNIDPNRQNQRSVITSNIIYCHRVADMTNEELIAATLREIAEFLPKVMQAEVTHWVVNRIPMAIPCPHPRMEGRRPPVNVPVPGLLLAGDWVDTGLPWSMESAVRSGWLAAEHVLRERGLSTKLAHEHRGMQGFAALVHQVARYRPDRLVSRLTRK